MTQTMIPPVPVETGDLLLTPHEVAARLRVPRQTLYGWLAAGLIPSIRLGRKSLRVRLADLDAFIAQGRQGREDA